VTDAERPLLLDTHVWIWFVEGARDELSPACVRRIDEARHGSGVRISAVSVREVAQLAARGRLRLSLRVGAWLPQALDPLRLRALSLDVESAVLSATLPGEFHRDPADQMLVATAIVHGLTLVTRDRAILDYARAGHVHALDAGARGGRR
jgi:PIN domain nuclease of toxin-antitoxin system